MPELQCNMVKWLIWVAVATLGTSWFCQAGDSSQYKRVCYYTNWSQYRPGEGKYTPDNINAKLCTHIIYAFGKIVNNQLKKVEWNDEQMFRKLRQLKSTNPGLKTLIAVGGWNAASYQFTTMVGSSSNRQEFIQSTLTFLHTYGFDGLDIDWEYPTERGGKRQDRENLVHFVKEAKAQFSSRGYLLTAAVPAGKSKIDAGYDVKELARHLDFINLMTYDLHGSWEKKTGENSPLHPSSQDFGERRELNMNWAAEYWAGKGVPKHKLIIGMATYGRTFRLANQAQHGMGAAASGPGPAGKFTREAGFMSYYEICRMQESGGTEYWDDEQKVPYYVNGNLWVGFDNVKSITEKVNWVKDNGYGGVMVWSLALDDFRNVCRSSGRAYPLLSVIYDLLTFGKVKPTTKPHTTKSTRGPVKTTTHKPSTTTDHGKEFSCVNKADDFYTDPTSCRHFYRCVNHWPFHYVCPETLLFDPKLKLCNWPDQVECKTDFYGY